MPTSALCPQKAPVCAACNLAARGSELLHQRLPLNDTGHDAGPGRTRRVEGNCGQAARQGQISPVWSWGASTPLAGCALASQMVSSGYHRLERAHFVSVVQGGLLYQGQNLSVDVCARCCCDTSSGLPVQTGQLHDGETGDDGREAMDHGLRVLQSRLQRSVGVQALCHAGGRLRGSTSIFEGVEVQQRSKEVGGDTLEKGHAEENRQASDCRIGFICLTWQLYPTRCKRVKRVVSLRMPCQGVSRCVRCCNS